MTQQHSENAYTILKFTYGLVPITAGLDKFTGVLADWESYISPFAASVLPFSTSTFMSIVGIVEIAVGLMVLTKFTRTGSQLAAGWLLFIAINLAIAGVFDVAIRDVVMAIGAWSLFLLSKDQNLSEHSANSPIEIESRLTA